MRTVRRFLRKKVNFLTIFAKSSFLCGFSCCRPIISFFRKKVKFFAFFRKSRKKDKDVRLFFQVWPKIENWQFFATVKNRLYATLFRVIFCKFLKNFKNFAPKQVYSLEIEAIFAKMTKMVTLDFSARAENARGRRFFDKSKKSKNF